MKFRAGASADRLQAGLFVSVRIHEIKRVGYCVATLRFVGCALRLFEIQRIGAQMTFVSLMMTPRQVTRVEKIH